MARLRTTMAFPAAAQTLQTLAVQKAVGSPADSRHAVVLSNDTQSTLAPRDLLKTYEQDMGGIALATCQSLIQIASALRQGQISDDQAEYATHQAYAMGMMQFQMLSTLHDILDHKIASNPEAGSQVDRADSMVAPPGGSR